MPSCIDRGMDRFTQEDLRLTMSKHFDAVMPVPTVAILLSTLFVASERWLPLIVISAAFLAANIVLSASLHPRPHLVDFLGPLRVGLALLVLPLVIYVVGHEGAGWYVGLPAATSMPFAFNRRAAFLPVVPLLALVATAAHLAGAPPARLAVVCTALLCVALVTVGLATFFQDLAHAARKAEQAQSDFLATMSHEIRTPMNGVLATLDLMRDTRLDENAADLLQIARGSASGLLTIINDILDFSKIQAGKLQVESIDFDLHALINTLESECTTQAAPDDTSVSFKVPEALPRYVRGDPTRIGQVLRNLLSNALKFGKGTFVELSIETVADRKAFRFTISDGGPGISPENQARLFRRFEQLSTGTARLHGGTGLGLAISRLLVEIMGGQIGIHSEPGQGASFWVELTLEDGSQPPESRSAAREPTSRKLHVLVVDDNSVNRKVAERLLRALDCSSRSVESGSAALEALSSEDFDCILMDCQMPEMDGFETTRRIRQLEQRTPPYVIALTANVRDEDRRLCFEAGMDAFLSKPVKKVELAKALDKCPPSPS